MNTRYGLVTCFHDKLRKIMWNCSIQRSWFWGV